MPSWTPFWNWARWCSFTGIVTFKTSTWLLDATLRVPMDRIMVETDSPYLTPAPFRKIKVNEPGYVPYVAKAPVVRGET